MVRPRSLYINVRTDIYFSSIKFKKRRSQNLTGGAEHLPLLTLLEIVPSMVMGADVDVEKKREAMSVVSTSFIKANQLDRIEKSSQEFKIGNSCVRVERCCV